MKRAAIYARYSSDRQSETSAEDQARLCRDRAEREGWEIVATFADLAISGATRDRPGLNSLLDRAGEFDIVLAESIDRLSRDQEDIAAIFKRLRFAGAAIVTLSEGDVSELHIGLKGTMGALFLKELGEKTRRGQIGRVASGRIPGGLSYGYRKVHRLDSRGEAERGLREIDPDQADVVRRIFKMFLTGISPRSIAATLNAEGVPGPTGGIWRASVINGNRARRNGILHNELYAGRIVYNRQRFEKHPITRKRIAKPNPEREWQIQEVPELAIVDPVTWKATLTRFERSTGHSAHQLRRAKRLFSGLIRCGSCGGTVTIIMRERWGCSTALEAGTCDNRRTISNKELEQRVLGALKEKLLAPDVIAAFVTEYNLVMERDRRARVKDRARMERALARADAKMRRLIQMIGDGVGVYERMRDAYGAASIEYERLVRELEDLDAEQPFVLHPNMGDAYRRNIETLVEALSGPPERRPNARTALRNLIDQITAEPRQEGRGLDLVVHGRLAQILRIAEGRPDLLDRGGPGVTAKMVAGTGFEPVTFRL